MLTPNKIRNGNLSQPILARGDLIAFLLLALFTIVLRGAWIGDPSADFDEQLFSLIGNAMLQGKVPFVDLWDRKPYGLFAIYAFAHAVGGPGPEAYQVLAALCAFGGAVLIYVLARASADRIRAAGAGILYLLLLSICGAFSGNSEVFFLPMMIGMAILVRDPRHPRAIARGLTAMLLGGIALQVKYTLLPQCLFFGLWVLWGQYRLGMRLPKFIGFGAVFGLLGVLPTAMVAVGYAVAGHWDEFVFANFVSFFDRIPAPWGRWPQPAFYFIIIQLAALILFGLNAARRAWSSDRPPHYVFAVLWLLASAATTFLPSTLYLYYLAALAPACVMVSLPLFQPGRSRVVICAVLAVPILHFALMPFQYAASQSNRENVRRLAQAIAPHVDADKGRCLYVFDGPSSLYRLSRSCLLTRFIYPDHLNNALEREALGIRQEDEVARILATRPPVIVTANKAVTPQNEVAKGHVDAAITRDYRLLAKEQLQHRVIYAWVRRTP